MLDRAGRPTGPNGRNGAKGSKAAAPLVDEQWGERLIEAMRILAQDWVAQGTLENARRAVSSAGLEGAEVVRKEVTYQELRSWLGKVGD